MQTYDSWIKYVHPEDMEQVTTKIKESQKTLSNTVLNHRIILKDGTIKYIEGEARFEFDKSGKPIGLYGIAHDVTEKRIGEEILKQRESRLNESQSIAGLFT
jgi:PAS domain S-box-containing protein